MELLCPVCDRSIIENESAYHEYTATMRKKNDKELYDNFIIDDVNLDEVDKIIIDYVTIHNEKFDVSLVRCDFIVEFDDFITNIKTNYLVNKDHIINLKKFLSFDIKCFESKGYKIDNIKQMIIKSLSDRCNMTYEKYINQTMIICERKRNMNIAKNPSLINKLDRNKNHSLIRKYSHIPFNI